MGWPEPQSLKKISTPSLVLIVGIRVPPSNLPIILRSGLPSLLPQRTTPREPRPRNDGIGQPPRAAVRPAPKVSAEAMKSVLCPDRRRAFRQIRLSGVDIRSGLVGLSNAMREKTGAQ